eukprot:m.89370 g.89370  ORF g.89370 m.89370 type:complete len:162 (+) comp14855_c0_seq29:138-623(+)
MTCLGEIWLPIWAPITTTEARLLVTGHEEVEYDNLKYEEQMFHFNTVTRVARYDHKVVAEGLDYCYDCRAEVEVLTNYLIKYKPELTEEQRFLEVARMSEEISRGLGRRTLWDDNSDPGQRKQGIAKRQVRPMFGAASRAIQLIVCLVCGWATCLLTSRGA